MYLNSQKYRSALMLGLLLISPTVLADENNNLVNAFLAIPELMRLVTAFAYVFGMIFIIKGLMEFKRFGETRSMYSRDHSLSEPLSYLLVGAALVYLPTAVQVMSATFFTESSPTAYILEENESLAYYLSGGYLIIELVGTIAFIRGFFLMSAYGGGRASQGTFKTALTQIIGGVCCINISTCLQIILFTFGLSNTLVLPD